MPPRFATGQPVRRVEDPRLLRGEGRYTADIAVAGAAHAVMVRSPHAHARIAATDIRRAQAAPGVLAVLTGHDARADRLGALPCQIAVKDRDGKVAPRHGRPLLCSDRVRFVGDNVAMVVAETPAQAHDAAELVEVGYDDLRAVTDARAALAEGAPLVWDDRPQNRAFFWRMGNAKAADAAFRDASRVVRLSLVNNRVVPCAMEPRSVVGEFDAATGRYTLTTPSQGVHLIRDLVAGDTLKIPADRIRVVTPDVGGGFGTKIFHYAEEALVLWAARRLGRPVRWTAERSETFINDTHGRDHASEAELALDGDGRFLALRVRTIANMGAYLNLFGPMIPTDLYGPMLVGCYRLPALDVAVEGVYTNTPPVDAYRGAGRPEACYLIERLVDAAARDVGLAPDELRRRNLIGAAEMPYRTSGGNTYDSGDFAGAMAAALAAADRDGFAARRDEAAGLGRLRGLGFCTYIEACAGGAEENAELRFEDDGTLTLLIGTQSGGQGHATAYAQLAADALGMPMDAIRTVQGDSDAIASGGGTGGSRSVPVGGAAVEAAARALVAKGRKMAARLLQAAPDKIDFADGRFAVRGGGRGIGIQELARAARDPANQLGDGGLRADGRHAPRASTFPNGCHVCEVEVDPDTGVVAIVRYVVADDFGTVINPLLLAGQIHGGVVQGIGQALFERTVYDPVSGQCLTASFVDYALPRAADVPAFEIAFHGIPCETNPLGAKGAGEAGAIAACPAVVNAVVDALAPLGIRHIDMPATPERVWRAVRDAQARRGTP